MRLTHWARPRLDPDEEQDMKYKTKEAAGLDKAVSELASDKQGVETELGDKATLEMSERTKMATPPYPFLGPRTRSRRPTSSNPCRTTTSRRSPRCFVLRLRGGMQIFVKILDST